MGSQFSELLFLGVPGTATEQVRTGGFRRNSSILDEAPKVRDSEIFRTFSRDPRFKFFTNLGGVLLGLSRIKYIL